jgi:RNA-binding protein
MALTPKQRRQLAATGHRLKPSIVLGEQDVTDAVTEHVRRAFDSAELVKIRVSTKDRDVCAAVVSQIVRRVPCEVVQRVGRVALLYRKTHEPDSGVTGAAGIG